VEGVLARAQEGRGATLITSNGNKPTQSPPDPPPQGLADSPSIQRQECTSMKGGGVKGNFGYKVNSLFSIQSSCTMPALRRVEDGIARTTIAGFVADRER